MLILHRSLGVVRDKVLSLRPPCVSFGVLFGVVVPSPLLRHPIDFLNGWILPLVPSRSLLDALPDRALWPPPRYVPLGVLRGADFPPLSRFHILCVLRCGVLPRRLVFATLSVSSTSGQPRRCLCAFFSASWMAGSSRCHLCASLSAAWIALPPPTAFSVPPARGVDGGVVSLRCLCRSTGLVFSGVVSPPPVRWGYNTALSAFSSRPPKGKTIHPLLSSLSRLLLGSGIIPPLSSPPDLRFGLQNLCTATFTTFPMPSGSRGSPGASSAHRVLCFERRGLMAAAPAPPARPLQ